MTEFSELPESAESAAQSLAKLARICAELWEAMKKLVNEYAASVVSICERALKYQEQLLAVIEHATPNERRMMHNKRLRIRKKYYNRVKRRLGL